jgi:gluconate 2-dehydrogenase gamma chain
MERPELQVETAKTVAGSAPVEPALQQTNAEIDLEFFPLLALHTRQGFYSDPIYAGNKNRLGWKLIGFEGPESLAETHAGRFTTLPFFAEQQIDWEEEKKHASNA